MTANQIIELLPKIEIQVCGILIENGICEYIQKPRDNSRKDVHNRFQNLKFTGVIIEELVSKEQIEMLRSLYPKGSDRKGDNKVIQIKAIRWLTENNTYTFKDILQVLERYVYSTLHSSGSSMLFNLNNIFYKTDNNKLTASPMKTLFEKYHNDNLSENDASSDFDFEE